MSTLFGFERINDYLYCAIANFRLTPSYVHEISGSFTKPKAKAVYQRKRSDTKAGKVNSKKGCSLTLDNMGHHRTSLDMWMASQAFPSTLSTWLAPATRITSNSFSSNLLLNGALNGQSSLFPQCDVSATQLSRRAGEKSTPRWGKSIDILTSGVRPHNSNSMNFLKLKLYCNSTAIVLLYSCCTTWNLKKMIPKLSPKAAAAQLVETRFKTSSLLLVAANKK